jgi:hypothetical protein
VTAGTLHDPNEITLPFDARFEDLVAAVVDVQKRARTNRVSAIDLVDEVTRSRGRLRAVAGALAVSVEALQPSGSWWHSDAATGEGTHTIVSVSGYPGHGTQYRVFRGSPSTGTSPGVVRLVLPRQWR